MDACKYITTTRMCAKCSPQDDAAKLYFIMIKYHACKFYQAYYTFY